MCLCDIVDKFLNQYRLADTSTTEEANLPTASIGCKEINHLNTGLQYLSSRRLVDERRRVGMDRLASNTLYRTALIYGFTNDVHDTAESITANGYLNGEPRVHDLLTTNETLGTIHGDRTDRVLA